jgi:hypothetical protein
MGLQVDSVATVDSTHPVNVVINDESGAIAIDYTQYVERIAAAIETVAAQTTIIATKTTVIADKTTIIADQTTTIATKLTAIETYQKKLKELGEGAGIHVVGPYDWLGLINVYKSLVEEGNILDTSTNVSDAKIAESLATVNAYIARIKSFPTGY